jgi:peroxiredoxin
MACGAAETADQEKPSRLSVLVGPDGKVIKTYPNPDPKTHADEVLADLG